MLSGTPERLSETFEHDPTDRTWLNREYGCPLAEREAVFIEEYPHRIDVSGMLPGL
jgi:hypothetical protein